MSWQSAHAFKRKLIDYQVVIEQFGFGQFVIGQFVIGQFNRPITFEVVV